MGWGWSRYNNIGPECGLQARQSQTLTQRPLSSALRDVHTLPVIRQRLQVFCQRLSFRYEGEWIVIADHLEGLRKLIVWNRFSRIWEREDGRDSKDESYEWCYISCIGRGKWVYRQTTIRLTFTGCSIFSFNVSDGIDGRERLLKRQWIYFEQMIRISDHNTGYYNTVIGHDRKLKKSYHSTNLLNIRLQK